MEEKQNNLFFLIADDHFLIRKGLALIINEMFFKPTVLFANTLTETIAIVNENKINVLILDIHFPEGMSLSYLPELLRINPDLKILIFSAYDEEIYALRYFNLGAKGYLSKLSDETEIKNAIQSMVIKGKYLTGSIQNKIFDSYLSKEPLNLLEKLSNREMEVARLLIEGNGNIEIQTVLNLKQTTVSTMKKRIFQKLKINNIPQLIELYNLYYSN